jgi:hypothetical protein
MEPSHVAHFIESVKDLFNVAKYTRSRAQFLIQASILNSRTTGFVSALKAGAAFNDERINALITDWQAINASAWLAWPTKQSHSLKQQTQLIATDLAKLNDTPKTEELQHLSRLLEAANRKIEKMLNPKKNLNAMLSVSLRETKGALSLQSIDPNHLENRESELIDMWHLCHRSSKFTDPSISLICKRICSQLKGFSKPIVLTSGNRSEELLNSIEEIHKVLEMIEGKVRSNQQKNRRSTYNKILPIVLLPMGVIAGGFIIMGMKDFSGKPIQDARSSRGESLLIKSDEIRGEACLANGNLKANAINSFNKYQSEAPKEQSKELVQSIAMIQQYVISCPQDAEAQIYLNNYVAMQWGLQNNAVAATKSMQFVKLAVVVPISRVNGVKDSLEILRGVSRAQYFINKEGQGHRVPTFIIQIFDDGTTKLEAKDRRQYACGVAQSIVQSVKNSDILAVIGHFSSDSTEATSGIYHLYNLPVISPTSTNVRAPIQDFNQRFSRPLFINSILNFTTDEYSRNFLSNFALLWAPGGESVSTRLCRVKASKGALVLDRNIYRMPPNDISAQDNLLNYLSTYNTYVPGNQSHLKVNRIVLIWERSNTSRYSEGFRDTLKEKIGDQYDFLDQSCRLLGSARYANEQRCKDEDILNNPYGTTALVLVPNSASIQRTEELTKDVLVRVPDRKRLMVFGADSFMTADVSDPIFKGLIIASASEERMLREPAGADRGEGKQIAFRWRSQMAYDSMILLREVFRKAIQKEMDFDNMSAMRSFVLDNITAEDIKAISIVDQQPVRIDTRTHDRLIAADSQSLNVLLCLENPGSTRPFRKLKVFNSPELQEEAGEASFCVP